LPQRAWIPVPPKQSSRRLPSNPLLAMFALQHAVVVGGRFTFWLTPAVSGDIIEFAA